jgi:hypothetical protein
MMMMVVMVVQSGLLRMTRRPFHALSSLAMKRVMTAERLWREI